MPSTRQMIWWTVGGVFFVTLATSLLYQPRWTGERARGAGLQPVPAHAPETGLPVEREALVNPENLQPVDDPSLDLATLKRAFQPPPPPSSLPPEARPHPSDITPPSQEWRQLQREQHALAN